MKKMILSFLFAFLSSASFGETIVLIDKNAIQGEILDYKKDSISFLDNLGKFSTINSERPNKLEKGLLRSCAIIEKNLSLVALISFNLVSLDFNASSLIFRSVISTIFPINFDITSSSKTGLPIIRIH